MNLEAYRVPDAVRAGVEIALPKADAVFRVKLPSAFNRPYTRAIQTAMFAGATVNPEGKIELGVIDVPAMRDQRIEAFCAHCLIMPLPGGMTIETLREDFFPALDWLFNEAERLAEALDADGLDAKKKSRAS
jgi:hypothetical protein